MSHSKTISLIRLALVTVSLLGVLALSACLGPASGLQRPNGVAIAQDGSLFVMDFGNHRIVHLDKNGKILGATGKFGLEAGQVFLGWDIAIGPDGNIYMINLVDNSNDALWDGAQVFSPTGKFLSTIGRVDYAAGSQETPRRPYALAVDPLGRIFIADFNFPTVRIFDAEGKSLGVLFGEDNDLGLSGPGDVVIDASQDILYIAGQSSNFIAKVKFTLLPDGSAQTETLFKIGEYGRGPGQFAYPQGMALDLERNLLYVGDMANRRIQVFSTDGEYLRQMAPPLIKDSATEKPDAVSDWQVLGITVAQDGTVYAADSLNNVIWQFSPQGDLLMRIEAK